MTSKMQVQRFMRSIANDVRDDCGEINLTGLAEAAAKEFDIYGRAPTYDIPEWVFEAAYAVAKDMGEVE